MAQYLATTVAQYRVFLLQQWVNIVCFCYSRQKGARRYSAAFTHSLQKMQLKETGMRENEQSESEQYENEQSGVRVT